MKSAPRLTSEMVAEVMIQGRAIKSGSFLFKYLPKGDETKAYFGFIASKKVFPTAVERNRARRRGRAALQGVLSKVERASINAFVLSKESLTIDIEKLRSEIEQVLIKSGILVKP